MMKRIGAPLAILLMVASAAVAARASVPTPDTTRMATAGGQITSIDPAANSLVVKVDEPRGEARDLTFVLADDAKIVKDGAAVTLSDLKRGDKVTITYRTQDGKNVVVNIGVDAKS